jgi:mono/diheme cytochrome c family protein
MKTKLLALIGLLAIVVAIVAAGYFFGGFYSVAATQPEPEIVAWALKRVRMSSVARHANDKPPSSLDDAALVRSGAKAFSARGCVNCHGAPGVEWGKWSEGLRPDPPDLTKVVKEREPSELFWVVKNGINMTGMPSFGAIGVPDPELWSIVAFLKKLPGVSPEDYKAWAEAR